MTDKPDRRPDEEQMDQWLRDLPAAEADPLFRDKLRDDFASGTLAKAQPPAPRRIWVRFAAVAAAAVVVLAGVSMLNQGPALSVLSVTGSGNVLIEGEAIDVSNTAALEDRLKPGARLVLPAGVTLDLETRDVATYELAGGTEVTLPGTPGRWFGRAVACSVLVGEVRLATGDRFAGTELRFHTPDGRVVVTGTLLSVQCDELGTCVCVLEGSARVGVNEEDLELVTPGNRKIMLKDGTVDIIPVKPMHRDGVLQFHENLKTRTP
jgi:ferric-dicitrate binding protein FerR (iron transport regulator)